MKHCIVIIIMLLLGACSDKQDIQHIDFITPVESALIVQSDVIRYHQVPAVILP